MANYFDVPFPDAEDFDARDCAINSIMECAGYKDCSVLDSLIGYLDTDTLVAFVVDELDCEGLYDFQKEKMGEYYDLHCQ